MDISNLTKKENIYKTLAIGLALVFIFSTFASGVLGRQQATDNLQNASDYFEGDLLATAIVSGYDPYIIADTKVAVPGIASQPDVEDAVLTANGYVISLRTASNITGVYAYLTSMNVSGTANAVLNIPAGATITANNSSIIELGSADIRAKIKPIFAKGENLSIRVLVGISENRIQGYGSVTVLPTRSTIERNATAVALMGVLGIVAWENRTDAETAIAEMRAKYGTDKFQYSKKDYFIGKLWNGSEQPAYVTLIAGDTIYVGNYTNRTQASLDFENATFPDSILAQGGGVANLSEFESVATPQSYTYSMRIIEGGRDLFTALKSANRYENNQTVPMELTVYAIKNDISSVVEGTEKIPSG